MQRVRVFRFLIYVSFLLLMVGLFYLQVLRFKYYQQLSLKNIIRIIPIEAPRGRIYARGGEPLVMDDISFDLVIIPQEAKDTQAVLERLSKISGIEKERLLRNYKRNYHVPFAPVKVATDLEREKAFYIEEKLSSLPGTLIWTSPRRYYTNNETASHIIGYVGRIEKDEFERLKYYGYKIQDLVGKSGIEKQYDAYLKGEDGGIQIEVDAASREVRRMGFKQPKKGKDLRLTIDLGLQRFVDKLLKEKIGSCIIMDTKTGEVLAFVSSPEFNPNIFVIGSDRERRQLLNNKNKPLLNRAIYSSYPPGSTFKIVVASAGVATGAVKKDTTFICNGSYSLGERIFSCWRESGHGSQNLIEGLTHSCNVFFYNLGRALGAEQIYRYSLQFGMGNLTGIDLPGETKGIVPGPLWKRLVLKEPWYEGDTVNYSIGQGYLLVTPIQMLRAVTIIANEGYSPQPYLAEEIEKRKISHRRPYIVRMKQETFAVVKRGMLSVVEDSTGTGQHARVKGLKIAAKTGTAQAGEGKDTHAWFAGYLPADEPMISFVIFLEHGGQGGREPAHIARIIATYLKENGFLN